MTRIVLVAAELRRAEQHALHAHGDPEPARLGLITERTEAGWRKVGLMVDQRGEPPKFELPLVLLSGNSPASGHDRDSRARRGDCFAPRRRGPSRSPPPSASGTRTVRAHARRAGRSSRGDDLRTGAQAEPSRRRADARRRGDARHRRGLAPRGYARRGGALRGVPARRARPLPRALVGPRRRLRRRGVALAAEFLLPTPEWTSGERTSSIT